jgi:hypothetical protein
VCSFFLKDNWLTKKINFFFLTGTSNASAIDQEKSEYNHYDIPKFHSDDNDNLSNNIKQNLTSDKSLISRLSIKRQSNCLIDDIDFDDAENTRITMQNKINDKSNNSVTYDKVSAYSYACLCLFFFSFFFASACSTNIYIYIYTKNETKGEKKEWLCFFLLFI